MLVGIAWAVRGDGERARAEDARGFVREIGAVGAAAEGDDHRLEA